MGKGTRMASQGASGIEEETQAGAAATPPAPGVDLVKVRELVLKANPDVVPEMVGGDSFDALVASVDAARAAYARILASVQAAATAASGHGGGTTSAPASPGHVPAGAPGRNTYTITIEDLGPSAKIAEGLRRRKAS